MFRTFVVIICEFVCRILEPYRSEDSECFCRRGLKTRDDVVMWEAEMEEKNRELKLLFAAAEKYPLAIEMGITPEQLVMGCDDCLLEGESHDECLRAGLRECPRRA